MNGSNKLVCYNTLGWKGLVGKDNSLLGKFVSPQENQVLHIFLWIYKSVCACVCVWIHKNIHTSSFET